MRYALFLVMSLISFQASAIEITNFTSGLACTDGHSLGWICHETEEVHLTGQGTCTWDGEDYPCTWYGFEFEYSGNDDNLEISCQFTTSQSATSGNPKGVIEDSSETGSFSFKLEGEKGRFYNPQYSLLATKPEYRAVQTIETTCEADETHLFEFRFNVHYPISG